MLYLQVCPPTAEYPLVYTNDDTTECSFPEALKYIEERCHGNKLCSMTTAPEVFGLTGSLDSCPGYRKYVEVAYKCKPTQFKSRMVCHSDSLKLSCEEEDKRLVIYSSTFASAAGTHIYCPVVQQNPAVGSYFYDGGAITNKYEMSDVDKCQNSFATEAVMQMCHGKSKYRGFFCMLHFLQRME